MTNKRISRMTRRGMVAMRWPNIFGRHIADDTLAWASLLALTLMVPGCGKTDRPFDLVPVQGKVTYEDGSPIPGLGVKFISQTPPKDAKTHPRPALAVTADDGTIEYVSTYDFGDGLIQGKHKVVVQAGRVEGTRKKAVHPKYSDSATTPLIVDTADAPFDIKVQKP